MLSGVLVVDKPRGLTSHDVVAKARRLLGTRAVGHAGTLDPMATGVLLLAIGEGTKLVPYLTGATKEYEATLVLGATTDSLDADGKVTREEPVDPSALALDRIEAAVAIELARTEQVPPSFSAIHHAGERAHVLARRGEAVVLPPRSVKVHLLEVTGRGEAPVPWLAVKVRADKGYYVRSLGRDLAAALGTVGHLSSLRRLASGTFGVDQAIRLDAPKEELTANVIPVAKAAACALPSLTLNATGVLAARRGQRVDEAVVVGPSHAGVLSAWLDEAGELVAIGSFDGGAGRVHRGFSAG